ncbi:MAG: hypothetical protein V2A73_22375 [Pseudomonadota bacterium]
MHFRHRISSPSPVVAATLGLGLLIAAGSGNSAIAQLADPDSAPPAPTSVPSVQPAASGPSMRPFVMGDLSSDRIVGVQLMHGSWSEQGWSGGEYDFNITTLDVFADLPVSRSLKVFGILPFAHFDRRASSMDGGEYSKHDTAVLGNITGGIRLVSPANQTRRASIGFGVSVSLPTAPELDIESEDDELDAEAARYASEFRLVDAYERYMPAATTVRIEGDARIEQGKLFLQAQLGLHLVSVEYEAGYTSESYQLLRLVVGAGVRLSPRLAIVGELSTLTPLDKTNYYSPFEDYLHSLHLAGQYDFGKLVVAGRFYRPFGHEMFDDIWGLGIDVLVRSRR